MKRLNYQSNTIISSKTFNPPYDCGKQIVRAAKSLGVSLAAIAKITGIKSDRSIHCYVAGYYHPQKENLAKLIDGLSRAGADFDKTLIGQKPIKKLRVQDYIFRDFR